MYLFQVKKETQKAFSEAVDFRMHMMSVPGIEKPNAFFSMKFGLIVSLFDLKNDHLKYHSKEGAIAGHCVSKAERK